jgi:DNA invertase Pin-like site-specific DNA recombinase
VFQALLDRATTRPPPFDVLLVHSLSRFARDLVTLELAARRLSRLGMRLVSITQETPDDANGELMRRAIAAIDEHHSRENAEHTLRAMRENARQRYWNGVPAPFGHRIAEAGLRARGSRRCWCSTTRRPPSSGTSSRCISARKACRLG